jgi:SagB-type dehydrogenase family enzyme
MFDELALTAIILGILMVEGTVAETAQPAQAGEERSAPSQTVALPAPTRVGRMSLEEALLRRRSVREFSAKPLAKEQLGQLLWAAQGITHGDGLRTAPSAGALYPLEIYVATSAGFFRYDPVRHDLQRRSDRDLRPGLHLAALAQDPVLKAPAVFIITAVYERTSRKYGADRSPRYVHLEAGHAAQNLLLEAVALGLGAVPIGAFDDREVQRVLSLTSEQPLYLIPAGYAP